jgi:hypothetical protein
MSELESFRQEKDEFFRHSPHGPLTPDQRERFEKLVYFPENPDLDLELAVEEFDLKEEIQMQTTTGSVQSYERYGRIHFDIEGEHVHLTLYHNEQGFFLPFVDGLAGEETYGAGRYLEPTPTPGGKVHVDFNLAYNPYCAYNEAWSCPITPPENRISTPIRAGEKIFADHV